MSVLLMKSDVARIPLPDRSVDLVFGSPPYVDARLYMEDGVNLGIARKLDAWVAWMLDVTAEALRVSKGAVLWVAAGKTEDRNYWPACEGLIWEWHKQGGHAYRPCYWRRNGIMGSGGDQWFRADVEYVMAFKRPGPLPWADNTAMGTPPKCPPGGKSSYRKTDGNRTNRQESGFANRVSGERGKSGEVQFYIPPDLANPGNCVDTGTGGYGHLGHALAHENEAPFPEDLAEFFVRSLCPPGGIVFDPFSGSGTTVSVAERFGRVGIGGDLRMSQCRIARQRIERPHAPVPKARPAEVAGQRSFLDLMTEEVAP